MNVGCVITNCDTPQETERCVEELLKHSMSSLADIVVVDDASTRRLPDLPEGVPLVRHEERKGYPASVNRGVREASGSDLVLLLDSDACPLVDLAGRAVPHFRARPQLGAAGMRLVGRDGRPTGSFSREPRLVEFLAGQRAEARLKRIRECLGAGRVVLYSCGVVLRREAFLSVGGFDESYEFLGADIDFSLRLQDQGWNVEILDDLRAFHEGGGSPGAGESRVVQFHRTRWKLLREHGHIRWPRLVRLLLLGRHVMEIAILRLLYALRLDTAATRKIRDRKMLIEGAVNGNVYGFSR